MSYSPIEAIVRSSTSLLIHNACKQEFAPGYVFFAHCHETVEILLIQEGSCNLKCNNLPPPVKSGELVVIFPHTIHSFSVTSAIPCRFLQIHIWPNCFYNIDPSTVNALPFVAQIVDKRSAYLVRPTNDEILNCMQRICREASQTEAQYARILTNAYIIELALLLSRNISDSYRHIFTIGNELTIHAINYISTHLEQKLSLKDVAQACHVSSRYLSQVFKENVNITVNTYISIAKVDKAFSYISSKEMHINDIAELLGFSSSQYFASTFKKYTGFTPTEFAASGTKHPF